MQYSLINVKNENLRPIVVIRFLQYHATILQVGTTGLKKLET